MGLLLEKKDAGGLSSGSNNVFAFLIYFPAAKIAYFMRLCVFDVNVQS